MHTKTILIVDDNAVQAAVRQAILKRNGYSVTTALNPARALEQLRSGDFLIGIDLVITDHIMPSMMGSIFVREIRLLQPKVPILVISGLEEASSEYVDLNVEFRVKPLQPEHLLSIVEQLAGAPKETPSLLGAPVAPATA